MTLARPPDDAIRRGAALALALSIALASGCASTIRARSHAALENTPARIERVAVAPFEALSTRSDAPSDADARLVAHQIAEALQARGLDVISPGDVARALGEAADATVPSSAELARLVAAQFGANALVTGRVDRFRGRSGGQLGSTSPASVGFEVTLRAVPSGDPLWTALFDETQHALSSNLLNIGRYPGGGTHWLTAEELVRWGAGEIAREMPAGP